MNALSERRAAWRARAVASWRELRRWPWLDTLRTLRQRFREDRLGLTAGSLTFTTTIALVPMMTVMLAIFSAFPMFSRFQQTLQKYLIESLVPDNIARPVLGALTQFASKANKLGSVGLVVLVLTALALLLTIDRTLNAIWRVRQPRPFAQRVLMYWAGVTLGPLLLGVSLSMSSYALSASRGLVQALPAAVQWGFNSLELLLMAAAMAAFAEAQKEPAADKAGDELATALAVLARAKKAVLLLFGGAHQKFGDKIIHEQEVLAVLSDICIDLFLGESAVLRALKARTKGGGAVHADLALIWVNDSIARMENRARDAIAHMATGDELKMQLGLARKMLRWTPLDTVALRRRIATRLGTVGSYPALLAAK